MRLRPAIIAATAVASMTTRGVAQAPARWQLVIDRHIGDGASDNTTLVDVRGIAVSRAGDVFVLDVKTQDIRMFDSTGRFVRRVAREGAGPGEIRNANGILARPTGGFVVNDPANARLTVWSDRGEYQRQIQSISNFSAYVWQGGWDGDRIVEQTSAGPPLGPVLRRIGFDGTADTLPAPICRAPDAPEFATFFGERGAGPGMMIPFLGRQRRTLDGRGQIWCSPGSQYVVRRYRIGSDRPLDSLAAPARQEVIPQRERDSAVAVVDSFGRRWPRGNVDSKLVPTVRAAVEWMVVDDQGRLWVKRASLPGIPARFDVWSQGRLVGTVESALRLRREIPFTVVGNRFYGVALDDDDVQTIVVATIRTGAR